MRKPLILLLMLSLSSAEFQLQSLDVSVKMNEDGSATVEERINFFVIGQYDMQMYEAGLRNNTLSNWQQITNISEIKAHISTSRTEVRAFVIRPQPLQRAISVANAGYGQIILSYSAYPYYDQGVPKNGTGMVAMNTYKPRVTRYTLNDNVFNFPRTPTGDIILEESTTLSFTPPAGALIIYANPVTRETTNMAFPIPSRTLSWTGLTLLQFSVVYEIEKGLDSEVLQFFSDLQERIRADLLSAEGMAAVLIAAVLAFSYFYLRLSRR